MKTISLYTVNYQTIIVRIHGQLLRSEELTAAPIEKDGLLLNRSERSVILDGEEVSLTPNEFDLLQIFSRTNKGRRFKSGFPDSTLIHNVIDIFVGIK